jgi:hypothetical protein
MATLVLITISRPVSPAVIFSAQHLNSNRELIYSSLFLKYMRYKHETFTKMILKDGFIIFLFNNISTLYLSNGSGWIDWLPCTGRKPPEPCFCTRPCTSKSLNSTAVNATNISNMLQKTACLYLIYFTRYVSAMFHSNGSRTVWAQCVEGLAMMQLDSNYRSTLFVMWFIILNSCVFRVRRLQTARVNSTLMLREEAVLWVSCSYTLTTVEV